MTNPSDHPIPHDLASDPTENSETQLHHPEITGELAATAANIVAENDDVAAVAAGSVGDDGDVATPARPTMLDQLGGPAGMIDSGLPVVVFVIVNAIASLTPAIVAALAAGVLIAIIRLTRRKPVTQAIGGLFAVGIAAYIAHRMGSARGFFAFGIWIYVVYGGGLLLSILVRWPLIGVLWESLNGRGSAWRADRKKLRRYDGATLVWVGVFAVRYLVQQPLYAADQVGWLAVTKIAMGYPLFVVAIILTVLIVGSALGISIKDLWRKKDREPSEKTG